MTGTELQVQLADQIRLRVTQDFDRVANAFLAAARNQRDPGRTREMIAILEDKRAEVMAHDQAGYFIREWQELDGRVRRMIAEDPRFVAIHAASDSNIE